MSISKNRISRRTFVKTAGLALGVGFHVGCLPRRKRSWAPNEKLNIAAIGTQNRAANDILAVASENIVALCDVDSNYLAQAAAKYPAARTYRDFRVMLEKEAEKIDAVVVGTPDHIHAPASAMSLRLGKHVYCEKPLTHTVQEARVLAELATQNDLVTQLGTQIHAGDNYRRVVELIESEAIGKVGEVHVWVNVDYSGGKFTTGTAAPAHLDWDLWLGPAAERPYSEKVHPFDWRRFWDYGTGGLGDFGCHYMDLAHWALKLRHPTSIETKGPPVDVVSPSKGLVVKYEHPARGDLPPVSLTWYDGSKQPEALVDIKAALHKSGHPHGSPDAWQSGHLFVGEHGSILSGYMNHVLLPEEKFADFKRPDPYIPSSIGHHREWIEAIKTGAGVKSTTCNFDYSGALTESVLLGVVSYKSGRRLEWDAENLKVTNAPEAQQLVHKEYRKGWTL